jgi:hypothetical protein
VWVDVPAFVVALAAPAPNPTTSSADVRFSLGRASTGRVEVIDLAGRRVAAREWQGLAPGSHTWRFDPGRALPSGIYTIRLVSEGRVATRRLAIVR